MANRIHLLKATPDLIAVHKPAGVPFHSMDNQQGLLAAIRGNPASVCMQSELATQQQQQQQQRLFAVHRLDTGTSGIVCFATSAHVAGLVARAFRERRVAKYYVALSARKPQRKQGSVTGDMARGRSSSWKLLRSSSDPAVTRFQSYALAAVQPGMRLYLLKPQTGRTHQLRVAMKSLGAAILGDALYGNAAAAAEQERMYLHAAALRVQLPDGSWFQAVDRPPADDGLFGHPAVQELCRQLLPAELEHDFGSWFEEHPLLVSRNTTIAMPSAAAVAKQGTAGRAPAAGSGATAARQSGGPAGPAA